ncbi:MAG: hypothetical protein Q8R55_02970 [Candidatus Taylorbacteria bacterium]|nr:hypothetical protein [Candidatus Taylorbacteria bacterium]
MIVVISGASGAGKTTIAKYILQVFINARMLESHTVRLARESDALGEYVYISKLKFFVLWLFRFFLWTVKIHGINYGTAKLSVLAAALKKSSIFLMVLTPFVLEKLNRFARRQGIDILYFYILSPGPEVLRERLLKRGDKPEEVERRVQDCLDWDEKVKAMTDIPFIFLRNEGDITEAANTVIAHLIEETTSS